MNEKQSKIKNSGNEIEDVDEQGLAYIASNFCGNVRELEGVFNKLMAYTRFTNNQLTDDVVDNIISNTLKPYQERCKQLSDSKYYKFGYAIIHPMERVIRKIRKLCKK